MRRYVGWGLTRDTALDLAEMTRHQYYYEPTGGRPGIRPSTHTQFWDGGQFLWHSNEEVLKQIRRINADPDMDYGYRRMSVALMLLGYWINHKKVYRLMKEQGLLHDRPAKAERTYVKYRKVTPQGPLQVLEMDIKYVWVEEHRRYAYILTILDTFTRVVLHWSLGYRMTQVEVKAACEHIIETHLQAADMIKKGIHIEVRNDNGPQFLAQKVQQFFKDNYLHQVFTHPYTPQENGHVESFHAILSKALKNTTFWTLGQLEQRLTLFYEKYNNERLHTGAAYLPPNQFWELWNENLIDRKVDSKKRVTFKLKLPYYQLSGNENWRAASRCEPTPLEAGKGRFQEVNGAVSL